MATPLATSGLISPNVETTSVEEVGWRRQYRRYGYPVPYAYYPPAYGYYAPPPAYAYYPPTYGYYPPPPAASGDYSSADADYGDYPPAKGDYGDYPTIRGTACVREFRGSRAAPSTEKTELLLPN
jgi:hypothetical protein